MRHGCLPLGQPSLAAPRRECGKPAALRTRQPPWRHHPLPAERGRAVRVRVDLVPDAALVAGTTVVVVDVLRMTTTATVLADLGLVHLAVVADVERARARARADGALLLGERQARPLPGFDGGNSPAEFTAAQVRGRAAVICTTNGSAAVEACSAAEHVLLGCLRNGEAVAQRALALARDQIRVVCAGTAGRLSLDDVAAAGHVVAALAGLAPGAELDDAALTARATAGGNVPGLLAASRHGRTLLAAGFADDLLLAAQRDVSQEVMERVGGSRDTFRPMRR